MSMAFPKHDTIVLAGGTAHRMGGADRMALMIGREPMLELALEAVYGATQRIVVGPRRPVIHYAKSLIWTEEDPPGGGPLSALAAGLEHVRSRWVMVVAGDLPFFGDAETAQLGLLSACYYEGGHGAVAIDRQGREEPLAAMYRAVSLRRVLTALAAEHGSLDGLPARLLLSKLTRLHRVKDVDRALVDCDTWEDVERARQRTAKHEYGSAVGSWLGAVRNVLRLYPWEGVPEVDDDVLLEVAREAADSIAEPAAPLTTFLLGCVVGQVKGYPRQKREAVEEAARTVHELARVWVERDRLAEEAERAAAPAPAD